jgi:hypothetical protein
LALVYALVVALLEVKSKAPKPVLLQIVLRMRFVWLPKLCAGVTLPWERITVVCKLSLGAPKAITAAAHKLARIFYRLWTSGTAYTDPGIDAYEQQSHDRLLKNLKKKAQAFGLELIPISTPTECVS